MERTPDDKDRAVSNHEEWLRHQYDPGHYLGGNVPHWMVHPGNRRKFAAILIGVSVLGSIAVVLGFLRSPKETVDIVRLISGLILAEVPLVAAIVLLRRKA